LIDQLEKAIADYDAEMSTAWSRGKRNSIEKGKAEGLILSIGLRHEYADRKNRR